MNKSFVYIVFLLLPFYFLTPVSYAQTAESNAVSTRVGNPPTSFTTPTDRVFYCQGNPAWSNQGCLGSAGCGVASIAMLLSSSGITMTPSDVLAEFQKHSGWYSCTDGSTMEGAILPSNWLKDLGFTVAPICSNCGRNLNTTLMKEYADKGYLFIGSSRTWPCANCKGGLTTVNHIVMLEGVEPATDTVYVRDPNNCDYGTGQEFSTNRQKDAASIDWYYVYALKKTQ